MTTFGIIGHPLEHSASAEWFNRMFEAEGIDACYQEYALESAAQVQEMFNEKSFAGVNVTYPYKQTVLSMLDELSPLAKAIGAVNVVDNNHGRLVGYNTDAVGFEASIMQIFQSQNTSTDNLKALILGTGGVSKAVSFVLEKHNIPYNFVSRTKKEYLLYSQLTADIVRQHRLIINCTPLGMFPDINFKPDIAYDGIGSNHILFDTIYNPPITQFLNEGKLRGAKIYNGKMMLVKQAEAAWDKWAYHVNY